MVTLKSIRNRLKNLNKINKFCVLKILLLVILQIVSICPYEAIHISIKWQVSEVFLFDHDYKIFKCQLWSVNKTKYVAGGF